MFCHKPIPVPSLIKKDAFQDVRLHILTLPKTEIRRKTCLHPKTYKFYNVKKGLTKIVSPWIKMIPVLSSA
ncbi:hypothetical protein ACTNDP_20155, partial [Paenibacillus barengoltzii]|uniref:hypothetical protein n=1 Tax=Paenibacillus barengoltzii TaxID=343517 RepID=UPI003F8CAC15